MMILRKYNTNNYSSSLALLLLCCFCLKTVTSVGPLNIQLAFWRKKKEPETIGQQIRRHVNTIKDHSAELMEEQKQHLSQQASRLTKEIVNATEQAARNQLEHLEVVVEEEINRLSDKCGEITQEASDKLEMAAKQKLADMEAAAEYHVNKFVDRLIHGMEQQVILEPPPKHLLPENISHQLLKMVGYTVILSAIYNLVGNNWMKTGFGDQFFPFEVGMDKQTLAGMLELAAGELMLFMSSEVATTVGTALVALLFGRGTFLSWQSQSDVLMMVISVLVTSSAILLLVNDVVSFPSSNKFDDFTTTISKSPSWKPWGRKKRFNIDSSLDSFLEEADL